LKKKPLRVLVVEDSELAARLLLQELERAGYEPEHRRVETPEDMDAALDCSAFRRSRTRGGR